MSLQSILIPAATGSPKGLVIILHGWGANADDVAGLAPYLYLPEYAVAVPNAPFPHPYTAVGRMWYGFPQDYRFELSTALQSSPELASSRALLQEWICSTAEGVGVPLSQTFLGGFSQGGAMTLDVGLTLPLAGLMVLSGYLHQEIPATGVTLSPILMVHGRQDEVVPLTAAKAAHRQLTDVGAKVQYHEFNMGHEIQISVLDLVRSFIQGVRLSQ